MSATEETVEVPRGGKRRPGKKDNEIFCYCREPEGNRFMIGCDRCNEWYHGDCIEITRAKGKEIDIYYCPTCVSEDPTLQIIHFPKKNYAEAEDVPQRCKQCINCIRTPDCGECFRCKSKDGRCERVQCLISTTAGGERRKERPPRKTVRKPPSDDEYEEEMIMVTPAPSTSSAPPARKTAGGGVATMTSEKKTGGGGTGGRGRRKGWRKDKADKSPVKPRSGHEHLARPGYNTTLGDRLDTSASAYASWTDQSEKKKGRIARIEPMQCLGSGCTSEARVPTSKYCSDECGMRLARERLLTYVPKSLENYWRVEPVAVRMAREEEARQKEELQRLTEEKEKMKMRYDFVLRYIESLKHFKPEEEKKEEEKKEDEITIACSVCAVEYGSRTIGKHIERCFLRAEKQATFGTAQQCLVNPEGIFCETFNKSNNTYCKRLRVICPEHYKGDIEQDLTICGCPKAWTGQGSLTMEEMFTSKENIISEGWCNLARKECKQHGNWIPTILGSIDARRIAVITRLEELFESWKKASDVKRGDALLLMCNQTVYHKPLEQIIDQFDRLAKKGNESAVSTVL